MRNCAGSMLSRSIDRRVLRPCDPAGVFLFGLFVWQMTLLTTIIGPACGLDNGLARLPPIGWTTGQRFSCQTDCENYPNDCISDRLIRSMADILSLSSFQKAGFRYIVLDDCWMDPTRDPLTGKLRADVRRFPNGIQDLISYVHRKNLLIGLYLDIGNQTCGRFPGSQGYFALDAQTMASWKVDLVKAGACGVSHYDVINAAFPELGRQLNLTGRPILYQCDWPGAVAAKGFGETGNFTPIAKTCNLFKSYSKSSQDVWDSLSDVFKYYNDISYLFRASVEPGSFSDPDQLVTGNFGLSPEQERFQLAFWSMIVAPLFVSTDLRTISAESKRNLLNRALIEINQDPLAEMAKIVYVQGQVYMWKKRLQPAGSYAIAVFFTNIFGQPYRVSIRPSDYSITEAVYYNVTDILTDTNFGLFKPWHTVDCEVNPTGALLLRFSPVDEL